MLSRVANRIYQRRQFQQQSFLPSASAEVLVRRTYDFVLAVEHGGFEGSQGSDALRVVWSAAPERRSLRFKERAQKSSGRRGRVR
jgi:hypothetical protein